MLTYFIRCSELLETYALETGNDEQDEEAFALPGSVITTSLRRGEVEESEYVLVTMHKPSPESSETGMKEEQQTEHIMSAITAQDQSDSQVCQEVGSPLVSPLTETVVKVGSASLVTPLLDVQGKSDVCDTNVVPSLLPVKIVRSSGIPLEKKPPDKSTIPDSFLLDEEEDEPGTRVTFLIGESMSPESDTESQRRRVEDELKKHKMHFTEKPKQLCCHVKQQCNTLLTKPLIMDQIKSKDAQTLSYITSSLPCINPGAQEECMDLFDEYFSDGNSVETRTIGDLSKTASQEVADAEKCNLQQTWMESLVRTYEQVCEDREQATCKCSTHPINTGCCMKCCSVEQDKRIQVSLSIPTLEKESEQKKTSPLNEWEIPRNESSDSALGDSESEDTGQEISRQEQDSQFFSETQTDWHEEMEVPFPGYVNLCGVLVHTFNCKWCLFIQ